MATGRACCELGLWEEPWEQATPPAFTEDCSPGFKPKIKPTENLRGQTKKSGRELHGTKGSDQTPDSGGGTWGQ